MLDVFRSSPESIVAGTERGERAKRWPEADDLSILSYGWIFGFSSD